MVRTGYRTSKVLFLPVVGTDLKKASVGSSCESTQSATLQNLRTAVDERLRNPGCWRPLGYGPVPDEARFLVPSLHATLERIRIPESNMLKGTRF